MTTQRKRKASSTKVQTPWSNIADDLENYFGFVYLITNKVTGKMYVGRKYLWKTVRKRPAGKKRVVKSVVESDWRTYTGSCKPLNEDIATMGLPSFSFDILYFCKTRANTNYMETREQFSRDVLHSVNKKGEYAYYNDNILCRYFRSNTL